MNEWSGLRTVLAIVAWLTLSGGLVMFAVWLRFGGSRAVGPEDELAAEAGANVDPTDRRWTSFGSAQIGMHALLGLLTVSLITDAAAFDGKRTNGYVGVAIAVIVTAVPGLAMFRKWSRGDTPRLARRTATRAVDRAEDHLPRLVVLVHGLGAASILAIAVVLFLVDR